jgi:hypothetical protein
MIGLTMASVTAFTIKTSVLQSSGARGHSAVVCAAMWW